jgi:hypothetical protein
MLDPFDFSNCPTFHSDLNSASDGIQRAIELNDKIHAERLRMIDALNKAIVVIGVIALFGLAVMHGAGQSRGFVLDQRERNVTWKR